MNRVAQKLASELPTTKGPEMGTALPYWLQFDYLFFSEGEEDENKEEEDEEDDEEEEETDEAKAEKAKADDNAGLKSALVKERRDRKKAEKDARDLRKFKEEHEGKDKTEVERLTAAETKSSARAAKLTEGFLNKAVDLEIIKTATKLGFADVDDAISLVKRADITSEQDEDDPSDVEVDSDSVKVALEALLKKKPHLKSSGKDDEEEEEEEDKGSKRTGSNVGSREKRGKPGTYSDDKLKELYPFLR